MNPAALKSNLMDLPKGGVLIVNTDAFNDRNLQKAGYASNPLEDGSLEGFHVHEVALTSMTVEALKNVEGITSREAERSKNFCALGLMCWLYHRPTEGTLAFIEEKFGKSPRSWRRTRRRSRRATTTARRPRTSPSRTRSRPRSSRPGATARSPATPPSPTASSPPPAVEAAALPRRLPDHAGLGDSRGARPPQELRRHDLPGGGRDRCLRRSTRRVVRRRARRHHVGRPGHRAQGRDGRSRHHARAAAADPRHPARRPLDRHADEARAGGSADGAVRPQRRVARCP